MSLHAPVDVSHVLLHESPEELDEEGETGEDLLESLHVVVMCAQQADKYGKEVGKERLVEVSLQVSAQTHDQTAAKHRTVLCSINLYGTSLLEKENTRRNF